MPRYDQPHARRRSILQRLPLSARRGLLRTVTYAFRFFAAIKVGLAKTYLAILRSELHEEDSEHA